jgi:hypothetical protein
MRTNPYTAGVFVSRSFRTVGLGIPGPPSQPIGCTERKPIAIGEFAGEDAAIAKGTSDPVARVVLSEEAVSPPSEQPSRASLVELLVAAVDSEPRVRLDASDVWLKLLERMSVTRGPHLIERRPASAVTPDVLPFVLTDSASLRRRRGRCMLAARSTDPGG